MDIWYSKIPIDISSERLMKECIGVITTNIKYCEKYDLDISTIENTYNPFDNF